MSSEQKMHSKSIKSKDPSLGSYFILCFLRVAMVFVPQVGYIHPDEFFQSVEVVAGMLEQKIVLNYKDCKFNLFYF